MNFLSDAVCYVWKTLLWYNTIIINSNHQPNLYDNQNQLINTLLWFEFDFELRIAILATNNYQLHCKLSTHQRKKHPISFTKPVKNVSREITPGRNWKTNSFLCLARFGFGRLETRPHNLSVAAIIPFYDSWIGHSLASLLLFLKLNLRFFIKLLLTSSYQIKSQIGLI